jgi:hypothetical protein
MLSNGFANTICLRRRPSRLLAAYLIVIHLLALTALLQPLAVPAWFGAIGFGAVLISIGYHSRLYLRLADSANAYWIWNSDGYWRHGALQGVFSLQEPGSVNTPWFVVLILSGPDGKSRRRLLLIRDQLDADDFRRLRVRLRFFHDVASARRVAPL